MRECSTSSVTPRIRTVMRNKLWTRSGLSPPKFEPNAQLLINGKFDTTDRNPLFISLLVFILVFIPCFSGVNAMSLLECGERLKAAREVSWNATNGTTPAPVLRLSREECVAECGAGIGDVSWEAFSQSFGAWFLPWIALMFQIPFGAECTW